MSSSIPSGYNTLSPYIIVKNAAEAIEFYKKAFGATEVTRLENPQGGGIMHAALQIGNSTLMMSEENIEWGHPSPLSLKGTPVSIHVYVNNVDEAFPKAIQAGATEVMPVQEMFWGDRFGSLKDPYGHVWSMATKVKDLSPAEVKAAAAEACQQATPSC